MKKNKTAIVHYWWNTNRGGEAVVGELLKIFPDADLYLHVGNKSVIAERLPPNFTGSIKFSFVSRLPFAKKIYQKYLFLMPLALEQLDLSAYDLVLSSESGPAKGVISRPDAIHICYCHSPMRYVWDMFHEYKNNSGVLIRLAFPLLAHWLRVWDFASAARVDYFVANSNFVARRIRKFYRRESAVIFPPVNVELFDYELPRESFYLVLGQLVAYKRADLAVEVFNKLDLPLVVIGEGELYERLKGIAKPNVKLLGRQPFDVVKSHLERCRALIFPGVEDFGIVPVEAMAAGAPVIAFGEGGALDTVIDGKTGILFRTQDQDSLQEAVLKLENNEIGFDAAELNLYARKFSSGRFREEFEKFCAQCVQ